MNVVHARTAALVASLALTTGCNESSADAAAPQKKAPVAGANALIADISDFLRTWKVATDFVCPASTVGECHMGTKAGGPVNENRYLMDIEAGANAGEFVVTIVERHKPVHGQVPTSETIGYGTLAQRGTSLVIEGDLLLRHSAATEIHFLTLTLRAGEMPSKPYDVKIDMCQSRGCPVPLHDGTGHGDD